ncbi:MAG: LuxR family transcriptional regulator [Nevskiaceae bacterium]|nr:MAG: LuxR family transcriptional regulator [Nevskiaceae bacterium]
MKQSDLDDLRHVTTREELLSGFMRLGESLGFPLGTVAFRSGAFEASPVFTSVTNASPEWLQRSNSLELAMTDPVFTRLNVSREPFIYDADFYFAKECGPLWEIGAPFGYKNGVSASLHISPNRALFWGFDTDERLPTDEKRRMELIAANQLIGVFGCAAVERVLGPDRPLLSERQREILRYVRSGRSSWVISSLTDISEETVNYHMKRIRAIMGVSTRLQAVDKAVALGLLD